MPEHSTVAEALNASGVCADWPDLGALDERVGIHGRRCALDTVLATGDRVEIYRPLLIDPKDARRKRASERRPAGKSRSA
ncbi:MAG: RnfH family protein [Ahniella sp.]|nr:RnfH family protein [Ahniella sp.]